jgi:TRAP-type C4-dicarboxylate transport system permease large subunit
VTKASIPFFCVMLASIVVLAVFPEIATFLPKYMVQR